MNRVVPTLFAFLALFLLTEEGTDGAVLLGAAVTGLVTGTVGTVLAALALGAQVGSLLAAKEEDMPAMMMAHGYNKRSTDDFKERIKKEKSKLEKFIDKAYEPDRSQCVERLVCNITSRRLLGEELKPIEDGLLEWIEYDITRGVTFKKMANAQKIARDGTDCEVSFDSCPLKISEMLHFMDQTAKVALRTMRTKMNKQIS